MGILVSMDEVGLILCFMTMRGLFKRLVTAGTFPSYVIELYSTEIGPLEQHLHDDCQAVIYVDPVCALAFPSTIPTPTTANFHCHSLIPAVYSSHLDYKPMDPWHVRGNHSIGETLLSHRENMQNSIQTASSVSI